MDIHGIEGFLIYSLVMPKYKFLATAVNERRRGRGEEEEGGGGEEIGEEVRIGIGQSRFYRWIFLRCVNCYSFYPFHECLP